MNSTALSDLSVGTALPSADSPTPPPCDKKPAAGAFGALLQVATGQSQPDEETKEEPLPPLPVSEKKKEDPTIVIPMICFCPPPDLPPTPPPATGEGIEIDPVTADASGDALEIPQPIAAQTQTNTPISTQISMPLPPEKSAEKPLEKIVRPKVAKEEAQKQTKGALSLPRELFEPVELPEKAAISMNLPTAKAAEAPPQAVANASHGTLVAKMESRVKNNEKSAEIAPQDEQKMPVRAALRRIVPEVARVESFQAGKESSQLLKADFQADAAPEIIPVKSLDAAHLVETIRTEVTHLRQRGDVAMSVVLKPDNGTQLTLDVSISRDGTIQAQARCERGDFQNLHAQWPQLQQSLAVHGIQMADLSGQNHSQSQHQSSQGGFANFDRGQNPQQRNQRENAAFEDQLAGAPPRFNLPAKPSTQTPATTAPARRWQSWA